MAADREQMTVREMREKVRAASALLDEVADCLPEFTEANLDWWSVGPEAGYRMREARQRVRMLEQELAVADDPRLPHLPKLKRLVNRRTGGTSRGR